MIFALLFSPLVVLSCDVKFFSDTGCADYKFTRSASNDDRSGDGVRYNSPGDVKSFRIDEFGCAGVRLVDDDGGFLGGKRNDCVLNWESIIGPCEIWTQRPRCVMINDDLRNDMKEVWIYPRPTNPFNNEPRPPPADMVWGLKDPDAPVSEWSSKNSLNFGRAVSVVGNNGGQIAIVGVVGLVAAALIVHFKSAKNAYVIEDTQVGV